ncbi:MAG: metal ABC transporter permease [Chloroflexi bacterium]|nr:metal ABC transporter permease [Chloroflexota bacterium]
MSNPFEFEFMVRALIGGVLSGAIAPSLGLFIYLRRLSLVADTLAHVALMGVAIGLIANVFPPLVALVTATGAAAAIEIMRSRRILPGDAALAVFLYSSLAVAVVIIGFSDGFNSDLFGYLFGSILTVSATDLWLLAGLGVITVGFVMVFFSELAQTSFDLDLARTNGVRVDLINLGLAVLTGATITLSMRVVGVLLIGALIVVPVLAALRLTTGLRQTLFVSMLIGVISAVTGLLLSFYTDMVPGGAIVITSIGILLITAGWKLGVTKVTTRNRVSAS